jgi:hypothetical protein
MPLELEELLEELELDGFPVDELLELDDELLGDGVGVGLLSPHAAKVLASNTKQP